MTPAITPRRSLAAPLLAFAFASAGCSGGDGETESASAVTITSVPSTTPSTTAGTTGPTGSTGSATDATDPSTTSTNPTTGPVTTTTATPCEEMPQGCEPSETSGTPPDDPCADQGDGVYCGANLGGLADHGSVYQCMGGQTFSAQPCEYGCNNEADVCNPPPSDPCESAMSGNGPYCGETLSGGVAGTLYHCADGVTQNTEVCAEGCLVNPPGFPDECKAAPGEDLCMYANAGNGYYCGSNLLEGPADDVLFYCIDGMTESQEMCLNGCIQQMMGVPDECAPMQGNNDCCLEKPPGALTQSFTACGNGGSHYGIDYGTAIGTPIYAGMAGTVVAHALGFPNCYNNGCAPDCWNAFNYVKLKADCGDPDNPGNDFYIYYLHIDDVGPGIGNGAHVDQDQLLAYSGNSGCSSGPHIHIETVSVPEGQNAVLNTCNSEDPEDHYCG